MFACEKLQFINLNGLNSLTYIDDYFLGWDNNLVELDLSGLNWNSIIVGQRFLFKCNGLNEIYLPTAANTSENFVNALRSEIAYNGYWLDSNQGKFYVSAGESGSWKTALGYTDEQAAAHIVEA